MGKFLRLAGADTKRITLGDSEDDWIEVRNDISKREFAALVSAFPGTIGAKEDTEESSLTIAQAMQFQTDLFETFVKDWSVTDEKGKPVAVTTENYLSLSREASEAVDTAISEHFNALNPTKDEQSKSA